MDAVQGFRGILRSIQLAVTLFDGGITEPEDQSQHPDLISFVVLRAMIGYLGAYLPFALLFGGWWVGEGLFLDAERGARAIQSSISVYYWSHLGDLFVGTLVAIGVFLLAYRGHDARDRTTSAVAGASAILIALFPTTAPEVPDGVGAAYDYVRPGWIAGVHVASALVFFVAIGRFCLLFMLTTPGKAMSRQKKFSNKVYRGCLIAICLSIAALLIYFIAGYLGWIAPERQARWDAGFGPVFIFESVAVVAFGVAWLTKGRFGLKMDG